MNGGSAEIARLHGCRK